MTGRPSTRTFEQYAVLEGAKGHARAEAAWHGRGSGSDVFPSALFSSPGSHLVQLLDDAGEEAETNITRLRGVIRAAFEHWLTQAVVVAVILASTTCVLLETVPEYSRHHMRSFEIAEMFVTAFFTIELAVRIFIMESPCNWFIQPGSLVDLFAVLPWYVEAFLRKFAVHGAGAALSEDLADSFQTIRLVRVVRLAKAARHSRVVAIVLESVHGSVEGLSALFAFQCMGTVFAATIVFFLECDQEDTPFVSIPAAAWWALATVTAVGYGDMVPQTLAGRIAGSATMVGGVLITSCSVAITTHSFIDQFEKNLTRHKTTERLRSSLGKSQAPNRNVPRTLKSAHDLAGLMYSGDPHSGTMRSKLPTIQKELNNLLDEVHTMLKDSGEACSPSSALSPAPADPTRDAFLGSLEMLQEQSKVWFTQVQRLTDEIVRSELASEGGMGPEQFPSTPPLESVAEAPDAFPTLLTQPSFMVTPDGDEIVIQTPLPCPGSDVHSMPFHVKGVPLGHVGRAGPSIG